MTVIGTNVAALRSSNASTAANSQLSTAMERLSTGKRINNASDDAAGLAISSSMTASIKGMTQAIRNANDGIALAQTADGALDEASNILQRMRELSVQSASGTYQDTDRANMQVEVKELKQQLVSIMGSQFNGVDLFKSTDNVINIQTGADSTDKVGLKISGLNLTNVSGSAATATTTTGQLGTALLAGDPKVGTTHVISAEDVAYGAQIKGTGTTQADATTAQIGTTVTLAAGDQVYEEAATTGTATGGIDIGSKAGAEAAMGLLDTALQAVATTRASIGAGESRLQSAVNSLTTNVTNLTDAKSRIEDADFSTETTALAKAQILSQASTAMLAQANQSQQGVLKLLQ
ncbi:MULTISPECIES: flagellin [unclassified Sphingomonas]|uniref:flagellin N-terminal helical domain-containing protein n=1 Tax=unclassified Sphingomonas TaxID=196159 RepID=UPI002269F82A|nr:MULTISPECIES: flagellin [unclassified Sphingomonas]